MLNFDWYPDETVLVIAHSYFTEETCEKKNEHVKELCMHVNKTEKDLVVCEDEDLGLVWFQGLFLSPWNFLVFRSIK